MSPDEQPTIPTAPPNGSRLSPSGVWQAPSVEEMQAMLPQYEVLEILGRGGMGAVYKGRQKSLKRLVAIKILPLGMADDEMKFVERFQNEAQTMAAMNHPAIVAVHDFGETKDGLLYFIMEYVDGTDVQKMIQASGKLSGDSALAITAHVCDALSYAHKRGVIHRDIKPANILIDSEGHIKVADFGLAKMDDPSMTSGLTKSNMAMGTPDYVAPEVLTTGMVADHRADIYAVGVMLYQMLTGEVPRGLFKLPSRKGIGSDPRFDEIICNAMEQDREERYQSAGDLRRALDVILTTPQAKSEGTGVVKAIDIPLKPMAKGSSPPGETSAAKQAPARQAASSKTKAPPKKQSAATLWLSIGGIVTVLGLASVFVMGGKSEPAVRVQPLSASPVDAAFLAQVAAAPAARQVEMVEQKIEALNGTKVSSEPTIMGEKVTGLRLFRKDATEGAVPDISPLAALKDLDSLQLEYLTVGDITCLRGMKLVKLNIWDGKFTDVSVLQSFPLQTLGLKQTSISDFSVLKGKALERLDLEWCYDLSDLSFVKGMPLKYLRVPKTKVRDLSPIAGLPLVELVCDPEAKLDPALIASIPTLKKINTKPVSEWLGGPTAPPSVSAVDAAFLAQVAAAPAARQVELVKQKIEALNGAKLNVEHTITGEKVTGLRLARANGTEAMAPDVSPLAALKDLDSLRLEYLKVRDISYLRGLKLVNLTIWKGEFNDVSVLQSLPLQTLSLKHTQVSDFSVLKGKALLDLDLELCDELSDLSFIKGMPLKYLNVTRTKVRDFSPIAGLPLVQLFCDPEAKLDPALIRSIPTLKKINSKPVSEWQSGSSTPLLARSSTAAATPLTTPPPGAMTPATGATKDEPFQNSLGMKFVPVPGTDVLFCIHETRHRDYAEYAKMAKESVDGGWKIQTYHGHEIERDAGDHPVVNVSWEDAQTFCKWLSEKEGKAYRLPTDREWSLAVGIGREEEWKSDTTPATVFKVPDEYPWGNEWPPPQGAGNYSDESRRAKAPRADAMYLDGYDDGFPTTAPVMSFEANPLGLFDLGSNVSEWCEDWFSEEQKERVLRGASWDSRGQLSSSRLPNAPGGRSNNRGFRVVLESATPSPPPSAATRATAPSSPNGKTIDLLALVDVKRDTIAGEWVRTADGLAKQGPGTTDKGAPRLQLPYVPPEEYDFEVEFTAVNHNQSVGQIISAQARVFSWIVAGNTMEAPTAGFELFDNNPTSRPSEVVAPMERNLEEGRRYRSRVEVRKAGLRGFLDGVELVNWSGDFKRLSPGTPGNLRDDKHLGLRAAREVVFHKITVREITGTGKVDAGVNATQSADPAGVTATWTDWLGPRLAKGQYQGNGFIHEKDGITTDLGMKGTNITADDTTDAAIKLTYLLRDSKGAQITVRNRGTGPTRELYVAEDSGSGLYIGRILGDKTTMLVSEKYPAAISRSGERTLEFRVEGDTLKATVNSTFSISARDGMLTTGPGSFVIMKGLLLKKVEIAD